MSERDAHELERIHREKQELNKLVSKLRKELAEYKECMFQPEEWETFTWVVGSGVSSTLKRMENADPEATKYRAAFNEIAKRLLELQRCSDLPWSVLDHFKDTDEERVKKRQELNDTLIEDCWRWLDKAGTPVANEKKWAQEVVVMLNLTTYRYMSIAPQNTKKKNTYSKFCLKVLDCVFQPESYKETQVSGWIYDMRPEYLDASEGFEAGEID